MEPKKTRTRRLRDWFKLIPARRADYFLLTFLALDIVAMLARDSYRDLFSVEGVQYVRYLDFALIFVWAVDLLLRLRKQEDKLQYLKLHWYEILGLVPLQPFRYLLVLRVAKIGIAYFRLLRSDRDVSQLVVEEITFRFRDIFVDTISDAVFLRSLERVDDVMSRLDYVTLASAAFQKHQEAMSQAVNESIQTKSIIGELSRMPFMGPFVGRLGDDVGKIIIEVLETEVTGNIMKEITAGILHEMNERVKLLDIERLTGRRLSVNDADSHR